MRLFPLIELLKLASRDVAVQAHVRNQQGKQSQVDAHRRRVVAGPHGQEVKPIPKTKGAIWEYGVHDHLSRRSKRHFDLRLADPSGSAHSWYTAGSDKKHFPGPGESAKVRQTFTHTRKYMDFQGTLSGYGAGDVLLHDRGRALVHHADDNKVLFSVIRRRRTDDFALIRTYGVNWILRNISDIRPAGDRPKYRETTWKEDVANDPNAILTPKLDGAHTRIRLERGKRSRAFSLRESTEEPGPIEYTHKLSGLFDLKPSESAELRAETVAVGRDGRPLSAEKTAGLLNMGLEAALQMMKQDGLRLEPFLFDVDSYQGKNVSALPFRDKYAILENISRKYSLRIAPSAVTREEKLRMLRTVFSGKHPLTREGVVIRRDAEAPVKMKPRKEFDVVVRGVYPGTGKLEGVGAGGFEFSHKPAGDVAGRVGTGFSSSLRKDLLARPKDFLGMVARVMAQDKYGSGALRGPSFSGWHVEKNEARPV